jgi:peroxiredoxin
MLKSEGHPFNFSGGKKKFFFLLLPLGFVLVIANALGLFDIQTNKSHEVKRSGGEANSAPLFSLPDLEGKRVDLISFKGKVILIEFWATWCGPCLKEIPILNQFHNQYKKNGLVVIGISLDRKEPKEVKIFLERLGVEYLNLMGNDEVLEKYGRIPGLGPVRGIPATFLIGRDGRVCRRFIGLTEKKLLEEAIQPLL